jgi:hypothetical protein
MTEIYSIPKDFFTQAPPQKFRRMTEINPSYDLETISDWWCLILNLIDPDFADHLHTLAHDPYPLCTALISDAQTLVHGE